MLSMPLNSNKNDTKANSIDETFMKGKGNTFMINYQPIFSKKEILEEIKKVLEQEKNKDENCISTYDVLNLIRKKYEECLSLDQNLKWYISDLTEKRSLFLDVYFDLKNKQLIISDHCNEIFFTKQDGDLIIVKSECYNAEDILVKCGKEISKRYDKFIEDISFYRNCHMKNIKSTNSNFIVNMDKYELSISENLKSQSFFKLSGIIFQNKYEYKCNSNNIITACRNNETEIFKRIFVKISDCPEWAQETLYKIRKAQLEEQEKIEYKEMKKQQRLELVRKLNPFQKKHPSS